ncbi:hypothetical protein BVG16_23300 [Paenibacillus selenitireducens]|uniref:Uncharacterized protein n=1 Tax=Paenibacillus selenitireducens TaxID=1324314 RepID=A0A1T2X4A7_9BACL|nr:hypothetical protein BVG16_23300 [Paenibacillus selenitireducens]
MSASQKMLTQSNGKKLNLLPIPGYQSMYPMGMPITLPKTVFMSVRTSLIRLYMGAGQWWYIEVQTMAAGVWVKQIAINLFTNTFQMRTGLDSGGGAIS